ncbi:MAG: hypothetical protein MJ252_15150, partial [archaeon]|nr:hypothetical protein [archaeon]
MGNQYFSGNPQGSGRNRKKSIQDIIGEKNPYLEEYIRQGMNPDGTIDEISFSLLTHLSKNDPLSKAIFEVFAGNSDRITTNSFLFFYYIFISDDIEAKKKFILHFLFKGNAAISEAEYQSIVEIYFDHYIPKAYLLKISSFQDPRTKQIVKEKFLQYINYNDQFLKTFIVQPRIYTNKIEKNIFSEGNDYICNCLLYDSEAEDKNQKLQRKRINSEIDRFFLEKKTVGRRFTLEQFSEILKENKINEAYIKILCFYFKRTTLKNYINFSFYLDFFFKILECNTYADKINFIFDILSDTNGKYVDKNYIEIYNKCIEDKSKEIKADALISKEEIQSEKGLCSLMLNETNNIKIIFYVYFNITPTKIEDTLDTLNFLLEKNTFDDYIKKHMKEINEFYCFDILFYDRLKLYFTEEIKEKPEINLESIAFSKKNKLLLKNGLTYRKDFLICDEKIYNFLQTNFNRSYDINSRRDECIKIKKIEYDETELKEEDKANENILFYHKENKIIEIDFFPVLVGICPFKLVFEYLYRNDQITTDSSVLDNRKNYLTFLKKVNESIVKDLIFEFSRKKTFQEIFDNFVVEREDLFQFGIGTHYGYYYNEEYFPIKDMNRTLEDENIKEFCLFVVDSQIQKGKLHHAFDNYIFYSDFFYGENIKKEEEKKENKEEDWETIPNTNKEENKEENNTKTDE